MSLLPLSSYSRASGRKDGLQTWCKACILIAKRESHAKNPEKVHTQVKRWKEQNPDKAMRAATAYMKKYSFTMDEYTSMLDKQHGYCGNPSCYRIPNETRFHIDHDHACCNGNYSCGACIRGILCPSCNKALGLLDDNIDMIHGLVKYLLKQGRDLAEMALREKEQDA